MVTWRALAYAFICLSATIASTSFSSSAFAAQNDTAASASVPSSSSSAASKTTASNAASAMPTNGISIAVADFSGSDKELGRFLADTLLTDLAQSERLHMVERAEIGKALTELKLQSTGLAEPQDVKKVGRLLGADRLIVGSYLVQDNQLVINARLLDVRTGRVTPGGAANVTGNRDSMLLLVHQLAHRFHKRVTGDELLLENERVSPPVNLPDPMPNNTTNNSAEARGNGTRDDTNSTDRSSGTIDRSPGGYNVRQPESDTAVPLSAGNNASNGAQSSQSAQSSSSRSANASQIYYAGYSVNVPPLFSMTTTVSPLRPVTAGDMNRLLTQSGGRNANFFTQGPVFTPISRVRALASIIRASGLAAPVGVSPGALAGVIPDVQAAPAWASGYLLVAVQRGVWPANHILHPNETATWGFLNALVSRVNNVNRIARLHPLRRTVPAVVAHARSMVSHQSTNAGDTNGQVATIALTSSRQSPAPSAVPEIMVPQVYYTGLLIEALELPVQRSMGARIVDLDGQLVYPDPQHIPDIDFLEDHGMADYYHTGVETPRVGSRPLVVRAIGISGDDIVVSTETATRIRAANRRDSFLRAWHVGIVLDEGK